MFRQRYMEITRKRWYDVLALAVLSLVMTFITNQMTDVLAIAIKFCCYFLLLMGVYLLVSEMTHRHRQAWASAAILATMLSWPATDISPASTWEQMGNLSYALLLLSLFFYLKASRRYGPQWPEMIESGVLLGMSYFLGGLWPLYHLALPFLIVTTIAIRPIIHYKKYSLPALLIIAVATACLLFFLMGENPLDFTQGQLERWNGRHGDSSLQLMSFYPLAIFAIAGVWSLLGICALSYSLRSQRIHGDLSALTGGWWFILGIICAILRPAEYNYVFVSLLIPFSFCIGSYFNLLTLRQILKQKDRRIFRAITVATGFLLIALVPIMYEPSLRFFYVKVIEVIFLFAILFYTWRHYHSHRLPVKNIGIIFGVMALLIAAEVFF